MFAAVFILIHVLMLHALQWMMLPIYPISPRWFQRWMGFIRARFATTLAVLHGTFSRTTIFLYGDTELSSRGIVMSNHQMYVDWVFIWFLAYLSKMHHAVHIVLKASLRKIPLVGRGMEWFEFIFVHRSSDGVKDMRDHPLNVMDERLDKIVHRPPTDPYLLVIFPEGTVVSKHTRGKSRAFCEKEGMEPFEYVLAPKTAGVRRALVHLAATTPFLYDLTIVYSPLDAPMEIAEDKYTVRKVYLENQPPKQVHIHVDKIQIDTIPYENEETFKQWIYDRWRRKDALMKQFYVGGSWEMDGRSIEVNARYGWLSLLPVWILFSIASVCTWQLVRHCLDTYVRDM